MSEAHKRVVITGLGVVSPIGCNLDTFWDSLIQKKSGVKPIQSLPEGTIPVRNGAEVQEFTGDIENFGPLEKTLQRNIKKNQKVMCREIQIGVAACQMALHHSGLGASVRNPERTGIVYGCDYIMTRPEEFYGGVVACNDETGFHPEQWPTKGLPNLEPLWLLKYLPNMPASHVAIYNDLRGPSNSLTVKEASNNLSIAEATAVIQRGAADAMLVGSTGSCIHPLRSVYISGQLQLAPDRENPAEMPRPFDRDRKGVVLGEGAAAMVIESLESALARGAKIWGEIIACAASNVGPKEGRDAVRLATRNILHGLQERSNLGGDSNWHLHASGRGDIQNDASEALGIRDALGDLADKIPVVAAKSYFGNLGAGGAAVELIGSCLAMENNRLFQTMNCENPDTGCPIRIAQEGEAAGSGFVHLSYSPQGQASSVLIRRYNG